MMKAVVLDKPGTIPYCKDVPDPVPGEQEQIMHVKASSIKNIDRMLVGDSHYDRYNHFPVIIGTDGVGILEDGRKVYSGGKNGMMAEKVIVNNKWVIPVPEELDLVKAAALPNPAVSAWLSLKYKGQIKKNDTVLILGATGVTGRLAIQIAKHLGAGKVIALGRNKKILDQLPNLGADVVISLNNPFEKIRHHLDIEIRKQPIKIVLDYLWAEPAEQLLSIFTGHDLEAASQRTSWIQIGEMADSSIQLNAATLRSSGIELSGQGGGSITKEMMVEIPGIISQIFQLAIENKLSIDTKSVLIDEIESAWLEKNEEGKRLIVSI